VADHYEVRQGGRPAITLEATNTTTTHTSTATAPSPCLNPDAAQRLREMINQLSASIAPGDPPVDTQRPAQAATSAIAAATPPPGPDDTAQDQTAEHDKPPTYVRCSAYNPGYKRSNSVLLFEFEWNQINWLHYPPSLNAPILHLTHPNQMQVSGHFAWLSSHEPTRPFQWTISWTSVHGMRATVKKRPASVGAHAQHAKAVMYRQPGVLCHLVKGKEEEEDNKACFERNGNGKEGKWASSKSSIFRLN